MLNEISIAGITIIIILPFILKSLFRLNDYFGYIMGIRYLIIGLIARGIFNYIIPGASTYKKNTNLEFENLVNLSIKERVITWVFDLFNYIITFLVLYYCISKLSKPTQNYNSTFLFICGICIQYLIPFALYLILPILSKNEKFKEIIEKRKANRNENYLTEEYLLNSLRKTICKVMNDIGICLIVLFYQKKLISRAFCYINYFMPKIVNLLILLIGLEYLDKYSYLIYICPFTFGVFYYCKFVGNGQLTNKYKDDSDLD